jgi:hypothetical protein
VFLTNQRMLSASTVCALYKCRRYVESFLTCKSIKQHLRIKRFYGTSENAMKTQIWIAVSVYVLVAIVKKRLNLDAPLYTLLQILSLTLFGKMPILHALSQDHPRTETVDDSKAARHGDIRGVRPQRLRPDQLPNRAVDILCPGASLIPWACDRPPLSLSLCETNDA